MRINRYALSMTKEEYIKAHKGEMNWEWCSHCDKEVLIPVYGISDCPNCGKPIAPCNMCDGDIVNCAECVWYE